MTEPLFDKTMGREQRSIGPHAVGVSVDTNWTVVIEYECPEGDQGLIRAWGFDCDDEDQANLELRLLKDGSPVPDYPEGIKAILGGFRANELEEVWIPIEQGNKVSLQAKLSSGATTAKGRLKGVIWEKEA